MLDDWLYAIGGSHYKSSLKSVERYDSVTNEWTSVQSMQFPRSNFDTSVYDNKICSIGGYGGISEIKHCELYDPSKDKCSRISDLNKPRMDHQSSWLEE